MSFRDKVRKTHTSLPEKHFPTHLVLMICLNSRKALSDILGSHVICLNSRKALSDIRRCSDYMSIIAKSTSPAGFPPDFQIQPSFWKSFGKTPVICPFRLRFPPDFQIQPSFWKSFGKTPAFRLFCRRFPPDFQIQSLPWKTFGKHLLSIISPQISTRFPNTSFILEISRQSAKTHPLLNQL